jgi:hypothetical protein
MLQFYVPTILSNFVLTCYLRRLDRQSTVTKRFYRHVIIPRTGTQWHWNKPERLSGECFGLTSGAPQTTDVEGIGKQIILSPLSFCI